MYSRSFCQDMSFDGMSYNFGLWSAESIYQLTWHVSRDAETWHEGWTRPPVLPLPRRAKQQIPSWSWQSVDGSVGFSFFNIECIPESTSPCMHPGHHLVEPVSEVISSVMTADSFFEGSCSPSTCPRTNAATGQDVLKTCGIQGISYR
jgi:hypothetical protein